MKEIDRKLKRLRAAMVKEHISCLRLRGVDWFAWISAGGDSTVALNEEAGVAEVLITDAGAWILTNRIEAERIRLEEAGDLSVVEFPWESRGARESFVRSKAREIFSDIPGPEDKKIPPGFLDLRLQLEPEEVVRYRALGRDAAAALTATLAQANGSMTEGDLSGLAAKACWGLGIQPMLAMAAGEKRGLAFRHPITKLDRLGGRAMIVICGRRHGLFANVTRHVFWRPLSEPEVIAQSGVLQVESAIFAATEQGLSLPDCYARLAEAYRAVGFPDDIYRHHQGGSTGYRTREEVASPESAAYPRGDGHRAYAWNPSLSGAKIEDTILRHPDGKLEILSVDPAWPTREHGKRARPAPWVRF